MRAWWGPLPNGRGSEAASFRGICVSMPPIPNRDRKGAGFPVNGSAPSPLPCGLSDE